MENLLRTSLISLVTAVLVVFLLPATPAGAMTGSGTPVDPYIIYDVNDLQDIDLHKSSWYGIANDIDATETVGWNGGLGFEPINNFTGNLNGNGYVITGLYAKVNNFGSPPYMGGSAGLFGVVNGATIQNVHLRDVDLYGSATSGGLASHISNSTITGCSASGHLSAEWGDASTIYSGGFAGDVYNGSSISRCYSDVEIFMYSRTDVTSSTAGGFIGRLYKGTVSNSISNCYSDGEIYWYNVNTRLIGNGSTGLGSGFLHLPYLSSAGTIDNCYSTTYLDGSFGETFSDRFGFCSASANVTTTDSFFDSQATNYKDTGADEAVAKTTVQMKNRVTFTDAGWDFDVIWNIVPYLNGGYPFLRGLTTLRVLWYEPVMIIADTTLPDRADTSQNATIYWGENASVDTDAGGFLSITSYTPAPTGEADLPTVLPLPGGDLYPEEEEVTGIGWLPYTLVQPAAALLEWETNTLYGVLAIFAGIAVGVGVAIATGSALLAVIAVGVGLAVGTSMGVLGLWVVIVYAIFAGGYLVVSRSM